MKIKNVLLLLLLVAAAFGIYRLKYSLSYASDLRSRPWAYSSDPDAKLLVGEWHGSFTDPAGVAKEISLEIDLPVTEEEREQRASRLRRRKGLRGESKEAFDGSAIVKSRLGEERYFVYGAVDKKDMHQLSLHFTPEDEAKRVLPNDTLREVPAGRWQNDRLELTLMFTRQDASGFSSTTDEGVVVDGKLVWKDTSAAEQTQTVLSRVRP